MDWNRLIDAARAENEHGIAMQRGKKYTSTAKRVDLMRRHLGALGLETEIVQWGTAKGDLIVVKATITDETGRVLATGHAEEVRGQGNVNQTSALENAETSAIGRALAALGISGGEFASANEMDGVERKKAAQEEAKADPPLSRQAAAKEPPRDPRKVADALIAKVRDVKSKADLDATLGLAKFDHAWEWVATEAPAMGEEIRAAVEEARTRLDPMMMGEHRLDAMPGAFHG